MNGVIPSTLLADQSQSALYQRLLDFQVDSYEKVPLTFLHKLARLNGWTTVYSERVFVEYKRFLFMTVTVGHFSCPYEAVDQTWHFHLLYTKSYWNDLCGEILGEPLHHVPSPGGTEETNAFHHDYAQTLASYKRLFGENPPADIWEQPEERLQVTPYLRLIDISRYQLLPHGFEEPEQKSRSWVTPVIMGLLALCGFILAVFGDVRLSSLQHILGEEYYKLIPSISTLIFTSFQIVLFSCFAGVFFAIGTVVSSEINPTWSAISTRIAAIILLPLIFSFGSNIGFIIAFIVLLGFLYGLWCLKRCPNCQQWNVFNVTGVFNAEARLKQCRCSACGYEAWLKTSRYDNNRSSGGGGGDGCGGSGGSGGGGCGGSGGG